MRLSAMFKNRSGFTLAEVTIVVFLLGIIFSMSYYSLWAVYRTSLMRGSADTIVMAFQTALVKAQTGEAGMPWGVYLFYDNSTRNPTKVVVFAGTSYATRMTQHDLEYSLPGNPRILGAHLDGPAVSAGNDHEVVFNVLTGDTADFGYINLAGDNKAVNIHISSHGMVTVN